MKGIAILLMLLHHSMASSYLWTQLFMPNAFICTYLFGIIFGKYDIFSNLRRISSESTVF